MNAWERLPALQRNKPDPERRIRALDIPLPSGLVSLPASNRLKQRWEKLSVREQEVTALTCLGFTNPQMAARLSLSPVTIKGYMRQARVKWDVHDKKELRLLLALWDFSDWGPEADAL